MAKIEIFRGIPIAIKRTDKMRKVRLRVKKTGRNRDLPLSEISHEHKQALENFIKNPIQKRKAAIDAGFHPDASTRVMDKLLSRKPIVDKIEEATKFKHGVSADEKVATVIVDTLDANHPMKPESPDHKVRLEGAKEINKIRDNYPPKKIQQDTRAIHVHLTEDHLRRHEKFKKLRRMND